MTTSSSCDFYWLVIGSLVSSRQFVSGCKVVAIALIVLLMRWLSLNLLAALAYADTAVESNSLKLRELGSFIILLLNYRSLYISGIAKRNRSRVALASITPWLSLLPSSTGYRSTHPRFVLRAFWRFLWADTTPVTYGENAFYLVGELESSRGSIVVIESRRRCFTPSVLVRDTDRCGLLFYLSLSRCISWLATSLSSTYKLTALARLFCTCDVEPFETVDIFFSGLKSLRVGLSGSPILPINFAKLSCTS